MIQFGIAASQASNLPIHDIWWNIPAAVAYQLAFAWWSAQGNAFIKDNREEIRAALCLKTS